MPPDTDADMGDEGSIVDGIDKELARQEAELMADDGSRVTNTRCKLYKLEAGTWKDLGVGHAWVDLKGAKPGSGGRLVVSDEENTHKVLMSHTIDVVEGKYQVQSGIVLLFSDKTSQDEYGLSFEDQSGCDTVWGQLCIARGVSATTQTDKMSQHEYVLQHAFGSDPVPVPDRENLYGLVAFLEGFFGPETQRLLGLREPAAKYMLERKYLSRLFDLFDECEFLKDLDSLHGIWRVFRALVLFNNNELFRELFKTPNLTRAIAVFEYHPARPTKRACYRELVKSMRFRNPAGLEDDVHDRIFQIQLVTFFKETVVGAVLDEPCADAFQSWLIITRNEVLRSIATQGQYLGYVLASLQNTTVEEATRGEFLCFVAEMLSAGRTLMMQHRVQFLEFLMQQNLLRTVMAYMNNDIEKIRHAAAEIIWTVSLMDVNLVRQYCLCEEEKTNGCIFLRILFEQLVREPVSGLQSQWADIVRVIVETQQQKQQYCVQNGPPPPDLPPGFLSILYEPLPPGDGCLPPLVSCLFRAIEAHPAHKPRDEVPEMHQWIHDDPRRCWCTLYIVMPIIAGCIQGHPQRMSAFLVRNSMALKIVEIFRHPRRLSSQQQLCVLWFLKALVLARDELLSRHVAQNDLLGPVFTQLKAARRRCGLVASTCLSILEALWKDNDKALVEYVVSKYRTELADKDGLMMGTTMGAMLIKKQEQNADRLQRLKSSNFSSFWPQGVSAFAPKMPDEDLSYFEGGDSNDYDAQVEAVNREPKRRRTDDGSEAETPPAAEGAGDDDVTMAPADGGEAAAGAPSPQEVNAQEEK